MITKYYDQENSTSLVWNHLTNESMFARKCESRGYFLLKLKCKKEILSASCKDWGPGHCSHHIAYLSRKPVNALQRSNVNYREF